MATREAGAIDKRGPAPRPRFPWGAIIDVHVIGRYALIEYDSAKPGNARPDWTSERLFSGYLHNPESKRADSRGWMDIGSSFHSLEAGLVGCIAYASEGPNGQAARYFMKMIAADPAPAEKPTVQFVHDDSADTPENGSAYMNCRQCLDELPKGQSPQDYKRLDVSITKDGKVQVWCVRHNCNVDTVGVRIKSDAAQ